jgi:glutaminyl-tRNA synthetase
MSNEEKTELIEEPKNFIQEAIEEHLQKGRFETVITRLPPEPNGYMHVGHAWAFLLNYELSKQYGGHCNLRFDDTNPKAEETEFVQAIEDDIRWLGIDFGEKIYFASDYFDKLYEYAVQLVKYGKAYVDSLGPEEMKEFRGPWNEPGKNSPDRDRPVEENLDLLERMKKGEFDEGAYTLRAKIDMTSSNMNMRDPAMYRILKTPHHRTGDTWNIYPTYDWAHGQSDSIEGITHSLCSIEFENHRPLYDWFIERLHIHHPQQIEFARLNLTYTITSKRKLLQLVNEGHVAGWDDPRMPTIRAMRRRGYIAEAIRNFCTRTGVTRTYSVRDMSLLDDSLRQLLNKSAERRMAVLRPLKVVIENYPEGTSEELDAINNPEDESAGSRKVPFSGEFYIERDDFMEDPPKKFFRWIPGREVRLRYAYFVTCTNVIKDENGEIVELRCTYDPETRGGTAPDGRKVKATLHWVSSEHAVEAEVRLYDNLFMKEDPNDVEDGKDFLSNLNPDSLEVLQHCKLEPALSKLEAGTPVQFERLGYFCIDPDSTTEQRVFNRTVTLRDTWARKKGK